MAAPTVTSSGTLAPSVTTPRTIALTWNSGDLVVILGSNENAVNALVAPTVSGLTFASVVNVGTANVTSQVQIWTATAGSTGSGSVSIGSGQAGSSFAASGLVLGGHGGVGNTATVLSSSTNSVSITTAGVGSLVVMVSGDGGAAVDGATRVRATVNASTGTEIGYGFVAATWTYYCARWGDTGAAGTYTVGYTSPTGAVAAVAALEVLGASAAISVAPVVIMRPSVIRASYW